MLYPRMDREEKVLDSEICIFTAVGNFNGVDDTQRNLAGRGSMDRSMDPGI